MKIIKQTLEELIDEVDEVFLRIDTKEGVKLLIAGGINKSGYWVEFISKSPSLYDIVKRLEVMLYLLQEEKKRWSLERPHHSIIREYNLSSN